MARLAKGVVALFLLGGLAISACGSEAEPAGEPESSEAAEGLKPRPVRCASSEQCGPNQFCTTEIGACLRPPGCRRGDVCPAVCYGVCRAERVQCGRVTCGPGQVCCNESCGICTPPDGACTEQFCDPPVECRRAADCRTFSDYCTGCDCRALARSEPDPVCPGPGVQCFMDPCSDQRAVCVEGQCELAKQP